MENFRRIIFRAGAILMLCTAGFIPAVNAELDTFSEIPESVKKAKWIFASNPENDPTNLYTLYAKTFTLPAAPKTAKLLISADQAYRLYINGKYVSSGPARGYQISQPCDIFDAAKYLKEGKNRIAVRVYSPGKSSFGYRTEGQACALLFSLESDGKPVLVSDRSWKARRQSGLSRDTKPFSIQITGAQEQVDMAQESQDWFKEDFDDSKWGGIYSAYAYNAMPYYSLEPRGTKMLKEDEVLPSKVIAEASGVSKSSDKFVRNISALLLDEGVKHSPASGEAESVKVGAIPSGKFKSYVLDFGKTVVGMPILDVRGANGGEIIDIQFSERAENLTPSIETFTHSRISLADRMICANGDNFWQFFHSMGFRYAILRVRESSADNLEISLKLRRSSYPLDGAENFSCSNDYVNKLWEACRNGQRVCALDAYVDTPWREQAMWWGDARVQSWNTFMLENDPSLLRRGIRIMTGQKVPNGLLYGHAPTIAHTCILPDFNLVWILTLWDYYWQTGDISAFKEHKDTADGILAYFDTMTDPNTGLVKFDQRYWLFLDWTNIQKDGQPTVLNLWLLHALDRLSEMAKVAGMPEDAKLYAQRASKLRAAAQKHLVGAESLVIDGLKDDGSPNPKTSIHAQVLGKLCNLDFDFEKAKEKIIMPYLKGEKKPNDPSSYWAVYVLDLMIKEGHEKECYEFIKSRWNEMAEYGSTFENFENSPSLSHAWSAHPLFLIPRILLGVRQEAPGWKKVSAKPNFFEKSARAKYPTPQGEIKASYSAGPDGKPQYKLDLPDGIELVK